MLRLSLFSAMGASIALAVPLVLADSVMYDEGAVNISCKCETPSIRRTKAEWHEIFRIPRDGFTLDMNRVCRNSFKKHVGPDLVCSTDDIFLGKEYAFDPD